ncbi:MAG: carboxyl transferase domain-containing protein [Enterobacterales bacterium]|nr:carboxyl transferase domain-containing protein [Enterobacterales bacterium]
MTKLINNKSKTFILKAPCNGIVDAVLVKTGDHISVNSTVIMIESMKMHYPVTSEFDAILLSLQVAVGDQVEQGQVLATIELLQSNDAINNKQPDQKPSQNLANPLFQELTERKYQLTDAARAKAMSKRKRLGLQSARENIEALVDSGSFKEYGEFLLAAQRSRHSEQELMEKCPADGLICGTAEINGELFGKQAARSLVMAYDYAVFAGTQGVMSHKKIDRMLALAKQWKIPVVLFAEGGGGRPSDCDFNGVSGLDCMSFVKMASLSGLVPTIGILAGRCFAGNAALLGVCDVIIGCKNSTLGMAGPAMIEGGGLGYFKAEEIGPASVQSRNGVIDILVKDEAEAIEKAKQYLAFFQGDKDSWQVTDQAALNQVLPQNPKSIYPMRSIILTLSDKDSVLELRQDFARGIITCLIRIEGKAFGLIANDPFHLGGAIDAQGADKIARFMQLCDAFNLPMISLCDTPGFMVGPEAEKQASVRHISRIFVTAASIKVPFFTLVLRKGYGLGAQAMSAGSFHASFFTAAWPSGEFAAMGIEGAIKLAYAKQLAEIEKEAERQIYLDQLINTAKAQGRALNVASYMEIDTVIKPDQSRDWILSGLNASGHQSNQQTHQRPCIDSW